MAEVRLDRITVQYGEKTAIRDFSLHVRDGEGLNLLGPSPCGQTTVLRAIAGLAKMAGGEVTTTLDAPTEPPLVGAVRVTGNEPSADQAAKTREVAPGVFEVFLPLPSKPTTRRRSGGTWLPG